MREAESVLPSETDDDAGNLGWLYRRHWHELVRYVRRSFGEGPPEPEDVAQTAFTHFSALARPEVVENPRAFLFQAARNILIDEHRRAKVRRAAVETGLLEQLHESSDDHDPERVIAARLQLEQLESALMRLPERMRSALTMHRIDELSYVEIARRLGVSQTEAKRLVAKALVACLQASRAVQKKSS